MYTQLEMVTSRIKLVTLMQHFSNVTLDVSSFMIKTVTLHCRGDSKIKYLAPILPGPLS